MFGNGRIGGVGEPHGLDAASAFGRLGVLFNKGEESVENCCLDIVAFEIERLQ